MSRLKKRRKICCRPDVVLFKAFDGGLSVRLDLDELEGLRLTDYENMDQERAASMMGISRGTLQRLVYSGRNKVAEALTQGKNITISISGGNGASEPGAACVEKSCVYCRFRNGAESVVKYGGENMKVAVTYENGQVYQHFGHTPAFAVYTVENGEITEKAVIDTDGNGHGALAGFLKERGADLLICGGIGAGAKNALENAGIGLLCGVSGLADDAVGSFAAGTLSADTESNCDHHSHHGNSSCGRSDGK